MTDSTPRRLPSAPPELLDAALADTLARPRPPTPRQQAAEKAKCKADAVYFVSTYCQIYDNDTKSWFPFKLWPFQEENLRLASEVGEDGVSPRYPRLIILKARQEGYTWLLGIAHKLWKMLFHPITEVLVFSQSDNEAMTVLGEQRLRGMYQRLPDWLQIPIAKSNEHEFRLDNGSGIQALPEARGGDSRTVTDVVIDEADLILGLEALIARAEPTLGEKGQLIIIGRSVKERPGSPFKRRYQAAAEAMRSGEPSEWNKAIFSPWYHRTAGRTKFIAALQDAPTTTGVRLSSPTVGAFEFLIPQPSCPHRLLNTRTGEIRTIKTVGSAGEIITEPATDRWQAGDPIISMAWKDQKDRDARVIQGTLDKVYEQYPATEDEALSAASLDKRYAPEVIARASFALPAMEVLSGGRLVPGLRVFIEPEVGRRYGIGADPAGGMTDSDDSYLCVLDADTWEQVAVLQGKIEPTQFANYATDVSEYYHQAQILFELNNHGGTFLAQAKKRGANLKLGVSRRGETERRVGWMASEQSNHTLYDTGADVFDQLILETRDADGQLYPDQMRKIIHDTVTTQQLSWIDKNTLACPNGVDYHDDAADAWVLAIQCVYRKGSSMETVRHDLWNKSGASAAYPPGRPTRQAARHPFAPDDDTEIRQKLAARGIKLDR